MHRLRETLPVDVSLRAAVASDARFLTEMLVEAAFWRPDGPAGSVEQVLLDPELSHYVAGWPRPGDLGVIASPSPLEPAVGAAWLRFFTGTDPGYGFVDGDIPEVAMGVVRPWRGRGVGSLLLEALIAAAREARLPALSLSVESDNYARRLYERFGFDRLGAADGSLTMLLHL